LYKIFILSALDPGKQGLKQKKKAGADQGEKLSALDPGKQGLKLDPDPLGRPTGSRFQRLIQENKD